MAIEAKLNRIVSENKDAMSVARAYHTFKDSMDGIVPPMMSDAFQKYKEEDIFCGDCAPSLIMIPSPEFQERYSDAFPFYFDAHHNLPFLLKKDGVVLEGVRGAYYPFQDGQNHIDIVEMDTVVGMKNPDYFDGLDAKEKGAFIRTFYDALQKYGIKNSTNPDSTDRDHVNSASEIYVAFMRRDPPQLDLRLDTLVQIK